MFAVIEFIEKKRRLFFGAKIESERIALPGGEVFFIIKTETHCGRVPWKRLDKCLGCLREGVILPKGVALPDGVNIRKFVPEKLPQAVFFNSAVWHIKKEKIRGEMLCVVDEQGLFTALAEELILNFDVIKVITPLMQEYEILSEALLEKYGASLIVTDKGKVCGDVVISPKGECVDITFSGKLYTMTPRRLLSGRVLCPRGAVLPSFCYELCPEGVDSFLFAAALYEKCGVMEPGSAVCESFS